MTDDRKLLELAAKAAGIEIRPGYSFQTGMYFVDVPNPDGEVTGREWNPLTDDGDALRLAVKLGILVDQFPKRGEPAAYAYVFSASAMEPYGSDPYAATRRAIVRAAAALGAQP